MTGLDQSSVLPMASPQGSAAIERVSKPAEFVDFYADRYPAMIRLAVALLPNKQVAEDVVGDAFTKLFRTYSSVENPDAYIRRTVVNFSTSFFRRRATAKSKFGLLQMQTSNALPAYDHVLSALDSLPARQRAALILRFYEQCSKAEIADVLRCRPGTVKSLLSRGLAALREVIPHDESFIHARPGRRCL